jgi:SPP1 family predicted phage head-tail adaptor
MSLPRLSVRTPGAGEYTSPGAMNRRVTFYTAANPTSGKPASAFVESWAAIRAVAAQELDKAQQIAQRVSHLVTVPYQPGILENMTIAFNEGGITRFFQITAIEDPDERHVELRIMCFEINQNAGAAS